MNDLAEFRLSRKMKEVLLKLKKDNLLIGNEMHAANYLKDKGLAVRARFSVLDNHWFNRWQLTEAGETVCSMLLEKPKNASRSLNP